MCRIASIYDIEILKLTFRIAFILRAGYLVS